MKKYYLILTLFLFCSKSSFENDYIAKINGEIISVPEFRLLMKKNRAMVYNDLYQKYGAEDSNDFWITSFNDEIPIEILKKKALDECVQIKIQQILAKENNIVESISYSDFIDYYKKEKERRKNEYKSKRVIYGPVELTELGFFNYVISNMQIRLKNHLEANQFKVSDEQLEDYYQRKRVNHLDSSDNKSREDIPFASTAEEYRSIYIDDRYNTLIDSMIKVAKIEINKKVYESIITP